MRKTWMWMVVFALTCTLSGTALAEADGAGVYQRCFGCHKSTGVGIGGVFPPLAGHAAKLVSADRTYPVQVLLYGLEGEIEVEGKKYKGKMKAKDQEMINQIFANIGKAIAAYERVGFLTHSTLRLILNY